MSDYVITDRIDND